MGVSVVNANELKYAICERLAATPRVSDPADFLLPDWDRAVRAVRSLHSLPADWDGAGGRPVSPEKIASAVRFCHLMRDAGQPPPSAVYPLSDGNIMIEWRFSSGVIVRFEVESPGRGEFMATFPDGRKTQFWDYHWEADHSLFLGTGESDPPLRSPCRPAVGRRRPGSGGGSFQLAA